MTPPDPPLELVVAVARNGVIGRDGGLPWKLPADLAHFRRTTLGHPILMGRRTWESLGRPLPGRTNLVLTRTPGYVAEGAQVVDSLAAALAAARGARAAMVIGGAELYARTLPFASVLHLTEVDADVDGDVRFPAWDRRGWREVAREAHPADERHAYPYAFVRWERAVA